MTRWNSLIAPALALASLYVAPAAMAQPASKPEPLLIQEQGSFAVGGGVTLTYMPGIGVRGDAHFPCSNLNYVEIADLASEFLKAKRLD